MPQLRDALRRGRAGGPAAAASAETSETNAFDRGATWARNVLLPAIERANAELEPEGVAFRTDVNLSPQSTNHAHADFWMAELGGRGAGPKHSVNVIAGKDVWLYKDGAPGRGLGDLEKCGPDRIEALLVNAAEEFGRLLRGRS